MITVHTFELNDNITGKVLMTTQIDNECNPMVDKHFWNIFLEGGVFMTYEGEHEEEDDA